MIIDDQSENDQTGRTSGRRNWRLQVVSLVLLAAGSVQTVLGAIAFAHRDNALQLLLGLAFSVIGIVMRAADRQRAR